VGQLVDVEPISGAVSILHLFNSKYTKLKQSVVLSYSMVLTTHYLYFMTA